MKKKIFSIWSVLLVLVVSIAVLSPGCGPTGGTIEVEATLCGVLWEGDVDYTLTPEAGSPITGTNVSANHSVDSGNCTCAYVSGGPANAFLDNIAPSAIQTVSDGDTITFTLEFEENQDAWIDFDTWTRSGMPWQYEEVEVVPCQVIDVHFKQGVYGCDGYQVALNETSWLTIVQTGAPGAAAQIFVINDPCAVNKTPEPIEKLDQVLSIDGNPVEVGEDITLVKQEPVVLDVETAWTLVKETEYTKSINWFGVSVGVPEPGHDCVLFELVVPGPGFYTFSVWASAEVELVDDVDTNTQNNYDEGFQLNLTVNVP